MPNKPIYIGLLFDESIYLRGIDDIINLIYKQFPSNTLVIDKYVVEDDPDPIIIQTILEDFITKYPHGDRITISNTTFVLEKCSKFFNDLKINVPSFDECTFEDGIQKWNICCIGNLKINNGIAEIN
jgi:hypothetical protein